MSFLGHMGRYGKVGGQSEHRASRKMRDEIRGASYVLCMKVTNIEHILEEIDVGLKKNIEEPNDELDDQVIKALRSYKIQ